MSDFSQSLIWRNLYVRTTLWYALCGAITWALRNYAPPSWGALGSETLGNLVGGAPALTGNAEPTTPTALAASIAMFTGFAASLPVAWIYTLTRRKKGFQQSVVQTYLILPVVAAGIVVLVKHSLALAFSLGGIVAAVRFRTSLDDSKDAAGIFVVIGIGMAAAVAPSVAWVISVGFNLLMLILWWSDFGRPQALEGKAAEKKLERALSVANRTGTFLAKMDDEVLKAMSPEQLEALADRAWRRRKRNDPDLAEEDSVPEQAPRYERLLRLRTADVERTRALCEPLFPSLFSQWKFLGSVRENEVRVVEYGVSLAPTVTPGVVSDDLGRLPDSPLRGVELR
ncbi:DUF4956 domain-containing protein [Pseudogemmatithrix spongiicola]|uniref:DUF4956 domain-containing protein n=1 Tax=Pseudogemmatithrix spongiicola TaxID=3062599 RepID=A0AA49JUI8_9BACT|nr:DUF4956 domain-containing protein [Gemmatimonadaceae bacterium 'strain 138']WKW15185.1 DUF4956 domain-containing protein [Gemmatimonadaceae bacterium 'strain 318']